MPMIFWIEPELLEQLDPREVREIEKFRILVAMSGIFGEEAYSNLIQTCCKLLEETPSEGHELFVSILEGIIDELESPEEADESSD